MNNLEYKNYQSQIKIFDSRTKNLIFTLSALLKQFFFSPRCILFLNNRPKQSEINYFLSRSIDHSKQGKHRINCGSWRTWNACFILHARFSRRGGVSARGCEKSTMEKISSRSVTCRDNGTQYKPRYAPRNFHSRPRSSVIPPLRFRFLPAAFLKAITPAIYRAVGHYTHLYVNTQAENHARIAYLPHASD